ncbi:MAG: PRC-barrel domain-containing protein [Solirubrobacteraceae bacterium]
MDEGLPIAYQLLDEGVPVLCSDGEQIGTVASVLSEAAEDVFHGLLVKTAGHGIRFVGASDIASIHEHGVDLRIDSPAAQTLPGPEHAAPVFDEDPSRQTKWSHVIKKFTGRSDWHHET